MEFRPIDWSRDGEAILAFDASYVTDRIYALKRDGLNFSLVEEACDHSAAGTSEQTAARILDALVPDPARAEDDVCLLVVRREPRSA